MKTEFDEWNENKKTLDRNQCDLYFYEREVWWISLGINIGFEQDGKNELFTRPVLILKKFSKNVFFGVPLSTSTKSGKYYHEFNLNGELSNALLSQLRLFDSRRLKDKIGKLRVTEFQIIRDKIKELI